MHLLELRSPKRSEKLLVGGEVTYLLHLCLFETTKRFLQDSTANEEPSAKMGSESRHGIEDLSSHHSHTLNKSLNVLAIPERIELLYNASPQAHYSLQNF